MTRRVAILLLLLALPAWAADKRGQALEVGEATRTYLLHVPRTAPAKDRALVIAFHGGGTSATVMEHFTGLTGKAEQAGFVVIYPDGTGQVSRLLAWNAGRCCGHAAEAKVDDLAFVARLIDEAVARQAVDPRRVYVTGMSNGAMMAYRVAAEMPERIAAVAAVAGGLEIDPAAIKGPVPVLHIHGTADDYVPWNGGKGSRSRLADPHASVPATIEAWIKANGADPFTISVVLPDRDPGDGTRVVRHQHAPGPAGAPVILYQIKGGGHTWPGRARRELLLGVASLDMDANDVIWEFFAAHRKP